MKLTLQNISQLKTPDDIQRYSSINFDALLAIINGKLNFADNLDVKTISITFGAADSEVAAPHGLSRVPIGYFVVSQSAAMSVYNGVSPNNGSQIFLRSNVIGTASLIVF